MYVLDTDIVSLFLHHEGQQPHLERRILSTPAERLWISLMTVDEQLEGVYKLINHPKREGGELDGCRFLRKIMGDLARFQILPFDKPAKDIFDKMSAATKRIGKNDCKIAAIAMSRDFIVVTHNVDHFSQIPGVRYQDWTLEEIPGE